jgi:hypothetical protein
MNNKNKDRKQSRVRMNVCLVYLYEEKGETERKEKEERRRTKIYDCVRYTDHNNPKLSPVDVVAIEDVNDDDDGNI